LRPLLVLVLAYLFGAMLDFNFCMKHIRRLRQGRPIGTRLYLATLWQSLFWLPSWIGATRTFVKDAGKDKE
jgi:hypothetical protein